MSVLLLNATYEPMRVLPLRRALALVLAGKAEMVEAGDGEVRSASESFPVPAVIRLLYFVKLPFTSKVPLNRRTLSVRDEHDCQVAGCRRAGTTIDHVVPRSRGGGHTWENVVLMCRQHNRAKSDKLLSELGWKLKRQPRAPRGGGPYLVLVAASRTPAAAEAWAPYLPSAA